MSTSMGNHQPIGSKRYTKVVSVPKELSNKITQFKDKNGSLLFNVKTFVPTTRELSDIKSKVNQKHPKVKGKFCLLDLLIDIHQDYAIRTLGLDIGKNSKKFAHLHTVL